MWHSLAFVTLACCRSLNFPRPNAETLSRHSILGPSGLYGQWQPPKSDMLVRLNFTPVGSVCSKDAVFSFLFFF